MVYELGHVSDRFKNNNNNIGVGDPCKEGGFVGNLHTKRRRCGGNNVSEFIGNIAKSYMETTEGENWASNLTSHLNSRFPTSIDTPKNFIQQDVHDANLHQIISAHSSLSDLLVSNSFFPPQNDKNLGYNCYSPASLNIYNPILCGGSAYDEYIQDVSYGGVNLISPLSVKQSDLDIITSPEQVSSITACSYSDMISDTEAFDSITAKSSFQQQPFYNNNSQYRSFAGNNMSAYNMDHSLLSMDDVQSPFPNSCNVQQSFQNLPEASDSLQNKSNNQDSSDAYDLKVLNAYVMYKKMPANLRKEVSFQNYMHVAECKENLCKCHLHLELSSHFDNCDHLNCGICGPERALCGSIGSFQMESRKRKLDQSVVTDDMGPTGTGTLLDALRTKYPKLESSLVGEDATNNDQRSKVNGSHDQQETTVVKQSDGIANNETMKRPKLDSSTVEEDACDQQETTVVNQSDNIANDEIMKYTKLESSTVGEDAMDDDQKAVVGAHDQHELTVVNQSDDVSSVGEDARDDEQRGVVNDACGQQELTVVNQNDSNANNEMMKYPTLERSTVGEDAMDNDQRGVVSGEHDQPESTVVNQSDNILNAEMTKSPQVCSDNLSSKEMTTDEKEKSGQAITEASNDLSSGADVADLHSNKSMTPNVSMVDCDSAIGPDHTEIKIASLTDNEMTKPPQLCSDHLSSEEMSIDEKEKSGQAIIEASNDLSSGADVADLHSNKSMTPNMSMVDCDSALGPDHTEIKIASLTDNEMTKPPQLCSDHLSSEEMSVGEKEKSGQAIIEASKDLSSGADVADLNSNKSITPNVSTVDCDSVLEQDNTSIKIASLTDNDSSLEPEKIKIQSVSLADFFTAEQIKEHLLSFTSQKVVSENRAPSIGSNTCQLCSMDKLVCAPAPIYCSSCDTRIKRNVGYYRSTNVVGTRHSFCMSCYRGSHGNSIVLRGYGHSMPKSTLQKARNDEEKEDSWVLCDKCQCWQHRICGLYNDEKDVEGKAEYICPKCYLEELESGTRVPLPQTTASGAKDLPRTNLSDHIEQRLFKRLDQERQEMAKVSGIEPNEVPGPEGLVVRVVVSVEKQLEVRQKFINILHGEDYPSGFTYRSKLIFLFQKIEGVDVCLFGMCVQEFGSECGGPNQRCVYISYLDSVKYFRPERKCVTGESLRTFVYHEILTGYLEYCKKRGFATCYIWACPLIKGEDYIFYCHPETQRTPKQDKLRQWYKSMLKKATEDNIVVDHTNLYNQFFVPNGEGNMKITAARLPYFDGDYWSGAAENIVRKLEVEESTGGLQSKLPNKRILKAMGQDKNDIAVKDVLVMQKLGQTILPVKENFMIVHLQYICTHCREVILSGSRWFCSHCKKFQLCSRCFNADKKISESKLHACHSSEKKQLSEVVVNDVTLDTKDTDDVFVNSFFETRDAFLNKCQKSHFQFDTLSRAKYSSMMILYHLIYKPVIKPTCTACHSDVMVEQCWHCDTCTKYYICESCYKMRHGAYHPHSLNPPSMDFEYASKSQLLQMQKDWPIRWVLDTLMHASGCDRIPCAYKECNTMRRLFYHAARCNVKVRGGCKYCQRVWTILKKHSQICTDSDCKIPRCMDIKKHKEMLAARSADQQVTMNDQQQEVVPVG
ncbi:putative histone acetyltransferase chromatin regulator PHD family [Helianthus annuus]|nr:putative histone acetyltransferase chromatin regulator PHD family [Helianthus annuus]KAJ0660471.1 putative histone acetyltransferase chromatin regulator PHD family [Helianthus annuus]KAJ0840986.1 putative histone acetyltransferase chromatin regulator PHD family [Helianthus annuus]KAJ0854444.1 putative histone acetyltransferase chromatin regulator PHD family [Helianthus annuus]